MADLERGQDGYDTKASMPKAPGISVAITPGMYPELWKHLPAEFATALAKDCADMPAAPPGCSVM
jgi:hypothetical protein